MVRTKKRVNRMMVFYVFFILAAAIALLIWLITDVIGLIKYNTPINVSGTITKMELKNNLIPSGTIIIVGDTSAKAFQETDDGRSTNGYVTGGVVVFMGQGRFSSEDSVWVFKPKYNFLDKEDLVSLYKEKFGSNNPNFYFVGH